MPLIPALGRQRQVDLSEFEASLVYIASSRTARTVKQRNPVLKNQKTNKQKTEREKEIRVFFKYIVSWR